MSCLQWDEMLTICMEFDENSNNGAVIERKRKTIIKNVDEPKKLTPTKPKTTKKKPREKVLV